MIELPLTEAVDFDAIATFPEVSSPSIVTSSEIKQAYPQLGKILLDPELDDSDPNKFQENKWVIGLQESLPDNTIVSRTYADLTFDVDAVDFDFLKDGDPDEVGSETYWRVIQRFTEEEWFSNNSPELQDFRIWERSFHKWQQEILYLHQEIASLRWDRPQSSRATPNPVLGTPPMIGDPAPTTGYVCPLITLPDPDPGTTGYSQVFPVPDPESTAIPQEILCCSWDSISDPFSVTFDVGEALGGFVENDGSRTHILKKNTAAPRLGVLQPGDEIVPNGTEADPIKYDQRYIEVYFESPGRDEPTFVKLRRYGVENFRISIPFQRDLDPDICHHDPETERIPHTGDDTTPTMYKPPDQYQYPDNFWNDGPVTPMLGFGLRLGSGGSVATSG